VASTCAALLRGALQPGDTLVESRIVQPLGAVIPLVGEASIEFVAGRYVGFLRSHVVSRSAGICWHENADGSLTVRA
jgi:hypothetical protein